MEAVGRRGNDGSHRRSIGCGLNDVSKNQAFYQALLLTASVIAREVQGDIIQRSFSLAFFQLYEPWTSCSSSGIRGH